MEIFIGSKTKPTFLLHADKNKNLLVYTPDKLSKNEEFYEQYSLGKIVLDEKYNDIIFINKPVLYKMKKKYVPELIVKLNNEYILINDKKITKLKTL